MSHTARTESYPCALPSDNAYVRLTQNFPPLKGERDLKQARAYHLLQQPPKTADKHSWNAGGPPPSSKQLFLSQVGGGKGTTPTYLSSGMSG